ncbi:TonB-dependent receptor [Archangium violaceum]|uniref:TonB-dependent receptor n=1 Tax=Archangium violaceum TaxID=83451 RepID=UPI0019512740|nr:TonB-dependent receptor [Archangium violaceum]QRO02149.1 TonB-dependent receptor [Archangium violaceum]
MLRLPRSRRAFLWSCSLSLLCHALPVGAQERSEEEPPSDPDSQAETLVTSSSVPKPLLPASRVGSEVTAEELSRRPARSTPEALLEEEGIFVQRTNHAGGHPIIRGLLGHQVLIMVDGVRLNNAVTRSGPNQYLNTVDPFLVDRLEVVRGPSSVLYGSDALGGVVNVLTLTPRFASEGERRFPASIRAQAGSADLSLQGSLRLGVELPDTAALGVVTGRDFNDLRGGAAIGVQRYTGYTEYDAAVKVRQRLAPGAILLVQYQAARQGDAPRTDRSVPGDFRVFSLQERDFLHGQLTVSGAGPFHRIRVDASALRQGERTDRFRVSRDRIEREDSNVWTFGLRAEGERGLAWNGASLRVGADVFHDKVTGGASRGAILVPVDFSPRPELARYPGSPTSLAAGLFGLFQMDLGTDATGHVGARAQLNRIHLPEDDRLALQFPGSPVLTASNAQALGVAGELGFQQRVSEDLTLFTNLGTGFRAPNVDDYLRLGAEGPGYVLPSRELSPEYSYTAEVGGRFQRGEVARVQAVYAYTYIDGLVTAVPGALNGETHTPDGLAYLVRTNADHAQVHAVELSGQVRPVRSVTLLARAAWVLSSQKRLDPLRPEAPAETESYSKSPPLNGLVRATWEPVDFAFVEGVLQWAAKQERLSAADREDIRICPESPDCQGTPGWAAVHLRAGASWRWFTATLELRNLTDASYRAHASGVDAPGRSVTLALEGRL